MESHKQLKLTGFIEQIFIFPETFSTVWHFYRFLWVINLVKLEVWTRLIFAQTVRYALAGHHINVHMYIYNCGIDIITIVATM